jgi:valine--pyruvate aminotransferase
MSFRFSTFGERFSRPTGALELMDDLGRALSGQSTQLMLGGGNPGKLPSVLTRLRKRLGEIARDEREFNRLVADYAHPQGELSFRRSMAALLAREYGWPVSEHNIAVTGGSQAAFFMLFNLFAGLDTAGRRRRILLPLTPEYVGYADVGIEDDLFVSRRPIIEELPGRFFKYRLDLEGLALDEDTAAVCVSRPTNPTGNVLTLGEMQTLDELCRAAGVPLIVDGAYGAPLPNIVFTDAEPIWNENVVFCMSLSKLGLPAVRTGIVVADTPIIDALTSMTAVLSLAVSSVGPVLVQPLLDSGELLELARTEIVSTYRAKAERAAEGLQRALGDVPFRLHKPEGAFFLWLWFPGLPIPSATLYARLKQAGVFVLSGHYFFPGLAEPWPHRDECLRVSFAPDDDIVGRGIEIIGRVVREAFGA